MGKISDNRKNWIILLKSISMLGVFLGHYFGLIKYSNSIEIINSNIGVFVKYFNVLFNEKFYMLAFCFISGYLSYNYSDRIISFTILIKKVILRYIRLLLPLILCSIFIYMIYNVFGINSDILHNIFDNYWICGNYEQNLEILFVSCFKTIITSDSTIASPLWMLSYIYRTNIYIYISHKSNKLLSICLLLFLVLLTVLFNRSIGLIMWVGFLFAKNEKIFTDLVSKYNIECSVLAFIILIVYDIITIFMDMFLVRLFFATCIVIMFSKINMPNVVGLFKMDISYIYYIIHFPIIISFTGLLIANTSSNSILVNILYPLLPTICLCLLSSVLINYVYNKVLLIIKNEK